MTSRTSSGDLPYANESAQLLADLWEPLRVLVLGPGETNKPQWFAKRQEIIQTILDGSQGRDEVFPCEELFRQQQPPPIELGIAELAHVDRADVIIALVMASPSRQGGVYRELELIAPYPNYRQKVWIFLPYNKSWLKRFQAGMLQLYREHQKIPLSWSALKECQELRQICAGKVEEERKVRMYDKFIARIHARGS